ncbi:lipid kinase [Flavobacterium album]|uniref:Lipid kinase n=1 Tax=Flavobacterium album TaxID=2175091 RepID=A0A2S1QU28_9FLAO|nr:diacylglycerol kinase family protein [Flavobacterium album]AWH83930.1 lipid kinase [Flavobacterium album]
MTYIHFIVNPISGKGTHGLTESYIKSFFPEDKFRIEVYPTQHKGHAIELAKAAVILNADYVVACGGDGTINEVASCLINTNAKLGIIPVGSGNGLASNLQIPRDYKTAMEIIRDGKTSTIDSGTINGQYFFSNTGLGIDAAIIRNYEHSGKRTLLSYIKASLRASFSYKPAITSVSYNNGTFKVKPFLLFISNSNEMGYNMSLTPKASLSDGWLDLVIVPELSFFGKLLLGYYVLRNKVEKFKKAKHALVRDVNIQMPENIFTDVQIDGEYRQLKTNTFTIGVLENALKVLTR